MIPCSSALVACLGIVALTACAGRGASTPASGGVRSARTIVIGATSIDPGDVTIETRDVVAFRSTAGDPLQVEFIQPDVQTGRIMCRVTDAQQNARREGPWAEFRMNAAGHFTAYVAPGVFASTCGFAPGRSTCRVRVLDGQIRPLEEKLGQLGTITVR